MIVDIRHQSHAFQKLRQRQLRIFLLAVIHDGFKFQQIFDPASASTVLASSSFQISAVHQKAIVNIADLHLVVVGVTFRQQTDQGNEGPLPLSQKAR